LIHQFHLSPRGSGGIFCDETGAFVGAIPMLARTRRSGKDEWRARDCDDLAQEMSAQYGLPVDMSSKRGGLTAIAKALNEGDVVRARIATVLLGIPDPPSLSKGAPSRQEMIKLACDLHASGLLKADWDDDEHPRWPAGAPESQGGRFAPKGDEPAAGQSSGSTAESQQPATDTRDAGRSIVNVTISALPRVLRLRRRATTGATTTGGMLPTVRIAASTQVTAVTLAACKWPTPRSSGMDWGSLKQILRIGKM
jgi:hypothetical protein